jgi:hypothetical protein
MSKYSAGFHDFGGALAACRMIALPSARQPLCASSTGDRLWKFDINVFHAVGFVHDFQHPVGSIFRELTLGLHLKQFDPPRVQIHHECLAIPESFKNRW